MRVLVLLDQRVDPSKSLPFESKDSKKPVRVNLSGASMVPSLVDLSA
jgi:hypothetical protein